MLAAFDDDRHKVNRTPGLMTPLFARVKGEAETSLLALRSEHTGLRIWNVRPGFIDESQHPRKEGSKPLVERVAHRVAPAFRAVWPNGVSPTDALAEVLERCALETGTKDGIKAQFEGKGFMMEEGETLGVLLANTGIRRLAKI